MSARLSTFVLLVPLFAALPACESTADLGETTGTGKGSLAQPPASLPPPSSAVTPDATLAEVQARCASPAHGPAETHATFDALRARIVGRWFACDVVEDPSNLYRRAAGIEFRADGTWHLIRVAADGTFVDQQGLDDQGTWHAKYEGFIDYVQVNWSGSSTNGMVLTRFEFENAPTRLRVTDELTKEKTWFVPLAVAPGTSLQMW